MTTLDYTSKKELGREEKIEPLTLSVAVVIPCYKVENYIAETIKKIPDMVSMIVAVDDFSPDNTSKVINDLGHTKVILLKNKKNLGVGGATKTGFDYACQYGADILIKLDGDGQMDPRTIEALIHPLVRRQADFSKGNRFSQWEYIYRMPVIRRTGNLCLSFLLKAASGYWEIFDPTNGFIAIRSDTWQKLRKKNIANDYFFESSLLCELGKVHAKVIDIPMRAKYGNEVSSLSIIKVLISFPPRLMKALISRILFDYYILDFNIGSLSLLAGFPLLLFGSIWSLVHWFLSIRNSIAATTGTVVIGMITIILGFQLILQFINFDIQCKTRSSKKG